MFVPKLTRLSGFKKSMRAEERRIYRNQYNIYYTDYGI